MNPTNAAVQLWRAVLAEAVRTGGRRSILLLGAVPGAVVLPLIVTLGVASVAERFATMESEGAIQVTSVLTTNSVYWVITFTVTIWAVVATYAQATAERGATDDLNRYLYPRAVTGAVARWIYHGLWAAVCALVLTAAVMLILPTFFPAVYGAVDIGSSEGVRFLITVPLFAVFAVGIGIGLAALIGHPATSIAVLLAWTYIVENAISLIPDGYTLQGYMPFLNGVYGTGQELVLMPPWGIDGALLYCAGIALALFVFGCLMLSVRRHRV